MLRLIDSCFDMTGSYSIVLCCYQERFSFSLNIPLLSFCSLLSITLSPSSWFSSLATFMFYWLIIIIIIIINIIIIIIFRVFTPGISHRSFSNRKSPQVFGTILNILTDLNKAVVWMTSSRPLISNSPVPVLILW